MANVEYIAAGEDFDDSDLNRLFAELDRKVGLMLDGKSPFLVSLGKPFLGNRFYWLGAKTNYAQNYGGVTYSHATFAEAAGVVAEISRDPVSKIMRVEQPETAYFLAARGAQVDPVAEGPYEFSLFARSLEAHKRLGDDGIMYWLWEDLSTVPEKRYRLAVAELVFDGWSTE